MTIVDTWYLGIHRPNWLADSRLAEVPVFISRRTFLDRRTGGYRKTFPKAVGNAAYLADNLAAVKIERDAFEAERDEAVAAHGRVVAKLTGLERDLVTARATVAEEIAAAIERHPGVTTHGRRALAGVARRHAVEGAPDPGPTPPIQGPDEPAYFAATPEGGTDV